ncbi:hypothetical protein ISG33_01250 [Glaciecola sp. MH2013]|uniref:hypothetical protein n=1 Tax=Glaciecola sp. MH2013 TaxID=2785524 RepID=UPI00189D3685|nr:hypothetical protein [Glaciecola sp. MH2013]MBF7072026.1 hypothetical protein [Glaciecola sp. MH2013]
MRAKVVDGPLLFETVQLHGCNWRAAMDGEQRVLKSKGPSTAFAFAFAFAFAKLEIKKAPLGAFFNVYRFS